MLTLLGASYIIQDITKGAARRKLTKNRIILFMSICDFISVFFSAVLGKLMIPKDTGVPGARGNEMSCDVQGFIAYVFGASSSLYNVSLALCYLLMVRYEYSDEQLRKFEPYVYFLYIPPVMCLIMAIPGLHFHIYNLYSETCFINASPPDCDKTESPIECERGEMYIYWCYMNMFISSVGACAIITCMVMLYTAALQRDRSGDQFRVSRPGSNQRRSLSNTMGSQGIWYSGAYLFSFSPLSLFYFWDPYFIHVLVNLSIYSIGFTNAVIYIRPRFLKFRRDYPNAGIASSLWHTLARSPRPALRDMTSRSTTTRTFFPLNIFLSGLQSFKSSVTRSMNRCQERKSDDEELCFPITNEKDNDEKILNEAHVEKENMNCVNQEHVDVKTIISEGTSRKKHEDIEKKDSEVVTTEDKSNLQD